MKRHATVTLLATIGALLFGSAAAQSAPYKPRDLTVPADVNTEEVKDSGNTAIEKLVPDALGATGLPKKLAILPLKQDIDDGYFTTQLSNLFVKTGTNSGFQIYTRDNSQWDSLLQEIQWGDQFGDTMDAATIQKFGRIQGVQALVVGRVSSITKGPDGKPIVRMGIQVFEVETGRQLWGSEEKGVLPAKPVDPPFWSQVPGGGMTVIGALAVLVLLILLIGIVKKSRPR